MTKLKSRIFDIKKAATYNINLNYDCININYDKLHNVDI